MCVYTNIHVHVCAHAVISLGMHEGRGGWTWPWQSHDLEWNRAPINCVLSRSKCTLHIAKYTNVRLHLLGLLQRKNSRDVTVDPTIVGFSCHFICIISRIWIEQTSSNGCPPRGSGGSEEGWTMPGMLVMILLARGATYKKRLSLSTVLSL